MPTLALLYFMLPAYVANLVPPLLRKVSLLDYPLELGFHFRKKPLLGSHKTWRGLVFGTAAGTVTFMLQQHFNSPGFPFVLFDYATASLWIGFLLSLGALLGDAVKSFVKRQLGIAPGKPWFVFDQIDYVAGALILVSPYVVLSLFEILLIFAWSLLLTVAVKHIGYYVGVNTVKW